MDRDKLKINGVVKASTILEVIISMVIILLVFTIAMMISANVMRSSLSSKKITAFAVLREVLIQSEQNKKAETKTLVIDDFRIEQEIKSYENTTDLQEIHLTAFDDQQQKVAEIKKLILIK